MAALVSSTQFLCWRAERAGVTSHTAHKILRMLCVSGLRRGEMTYASRTFSKDFGIPGPSRHRALVSLTEAKVIEVDFRFDDITGRQTSNAIRPIPVSHEEMIAFANHMASLGEPSVLLRYGKDKKIVSGWHASWIGEGVKDRYEGVKINRSALRSVPAYGVSRATEKAVSGHFPKVESGDFKTDEPLVGGTVSLQEKTSPLREEHRTKPPTGPRFASLSEVPLSSGVIETSDSMIKTPLEEKGASYEAASLPRDQEKNSPKDDQDHDDHQDPPNPPRRTHTPKPFTPSDLRLGQDLRATEGVPTPESTVAMAYGGLYPEELLQSFPRVFEADLALRKEAAKQDPLNAQLMKLPSRNPKALNDLNKRIKWLGGLSKVMAYVKFLSEQGMGFLSGFGWTDLDLCAIHCYGAIKAWWHQLRIEQGQIEQHAAVPKRLTATHRAGLDEWDDAMSLDAGW